MKKKSLFGGILILLVFLVVVHGVAEKLLFDPDPPPANYPPPENTREAQLQDIDYMSHFLEIDRSYSEPARASAKVLRNEVKAKAGSLSEPEFELEIARISALADNAHTNVNGILRAGKYPRLPVRTYRFSDGLYIIRAYEGFEELLGGRIIMVDGKPISQIETILRPYVGGPEEYFYRFQFSYLFEFPAFLHAAGITKAADRVAMTLEFPDGHRDEVFFEGDYQEAEGPAGFAYHMIYRDTLPGESGWSNLLQDDENLEFTLESARSFLLRELPEMNGYYIRYWRNEDVGAISISAFNGEVSAALKNNSPLDVIILDVRNNGGGDYSKNKEIMLSLGNYLASDGRLYIITGRGTFSAGMFSAAFAKGGAGDKAVFIGTRVGDRDLHWGENDDFTLPNSGVRTVYARGLHNMTGPCRDIWKCFWKDFTSYDPVDSLEPDINVPFNFTAYAAGRDAVMDKIREIEGAQ